MLPYIEVIWVEDNLRRRGSGRELARCLEDHVRLQGQKIIMSSSQADGPDAQAFHRKTGFRDAGALVDMRPLQSVTEVSFVKNTDSPGAAQQMATTDRRPWQYISSSKPWGGRPRVSLADGTDPKRLSYWPGGSTSAC